MKIRRKRLLATIEKKFSTMRRKIRANWPPFLALALPMLMVVALASAATAGGAQAADNSAGIITGWLAIQRGDGGPGNPGPTVQYLLISQELGGVILDEVTGSPVEAGLQTHDRKFVIVSGDWLVDDAVMRPASVRPLYQARGADAEPSGVSALAGPQRWASLLCKFSDISSEPADISYFEALFADTEPGLGHYWRQQSYNAANILGSETYGWYTLPGTRASYLEGENIAWWRVFDDCTNLADEDVYFPDFMGVNLIFNSTIGCCAWGGGVWANLDGVEKTYSTTWMPTWGWENQTLMAHEMGHGFGLPHSSGQYGETYDNAWDVMSNSWYGCDVASDPQIGCLGQHTISFHKDKLDWIPETRYYLAEIGMHRVTLERLAVPETSNYLMAQIPIGASPTHFYTLEVRDLVGYDAKLPGRGVVIHEVDTSRPNQAQVIDIDGDRDTADSGAIWLPGETFTDPANDISVQIDEEMGTGYVVDIVNGSFPTITPTPSPTYTPSLTPTPTLTPTLTPTFFPPIVSLEEDLGQVCDSFASNTCSIDFGDREYRTVIDGIGGNYEASEVQFGRYRFFPEGVPWSHRWAFFENGELIDKGARFMMSEAENSWRWEISGEPGGQTVTIYFGINHSSLTGTGQYDLYIDGVPLTVTRSEPGNGWYALRVTFWEDVEIRMQPKGDYRYAAFMLAAGVVEEAGGMVPTPTPTALASATPTPTRTDTPVPSLTPTGTLAPTDTPRPSRTATPTVAPTTTGSPTPTPTSEATATPPPEVPAGDYSLNAWTYIDYRCDGNYQAGIDIRLGGVPVTLSFANGATLEETTSSGGAAFFYGFDPSEGVILEAELPADYRGDPIDFCANSYRRLELEEEDFRFARRNIEFRAEYTH